MQLKIKYILLLIFVSKIAYNQDYISYFGNEFYLQNFIYENQFWTNETSNEGFAYFGNNEGIIEFDGKNWRLIEVPNNYRVRSLKKNEAGKIFVGGVDELGYLKADEKGNLNYLSLKNKLDDSLNFGEIWNIEIIKDTVYFQSNNYIFKYVDDNFKIIELNNKSSFLSYSVNNEYYIQIPSEGLFKLQNDKLVFITGSEIFIDDKILFITPFKNNKYILGSIKKGIMIFSEFDKIKFSEQIRYKELNKTLVKNNLYKGVYLNNEKWAFSTIDSGLYIIDETANILYHETILDKFSINSNILYLKPDTYNNLWVCTNKGFRYIEVENSIFKFKYNSDLGGNVLTLKYFDKNLYIGTSNGLYIFDGFNLSQVDFEFRQVWSIENIPIISNENDTTNTLLIGSTNGLFSFINGKIELINDNPNIYDIYYDENFQNTIFVGYKYGIFIQKNIEKKWINISNIPDIETEIKKIVIDDKQNIWATSKIEGVFKIHIISDLSKLNENFEFKIQKFDEKSDLPENKKINVLKINDTIVFLTNKGIFIFNEKSNKFYLDSKLNKNLPIKNTYNLKIFNNKEIVISSFTSDSISIIYNENLNKNEWIYKPFLRIPKSLIYDIEFYKNQQIWFATSNGIYIYKKEVENKLKTVFQCFINKITLGKDSILFDGKLKKNKEFYEFDNEFNTIKFEFISPFFVDNADLMYSTYLENYNINWSEWSDKNSVSYQKLKAGKYTFKVKSKNIYNQESIISEFTFIIKSPFYLTKYAKILLIVIIILIVFIGIKIYNKKILNEKNELENNIKKRTEEIVEQNKILEKQKLQIESQNEKLQNSFNEIQLLSEIGQSITSEITIENITNNVYYNLKKLIDITSFGIGIYNNTKKIIEFYNYIENKTLTPYYFINVAKENMNEIICFKKQKEIFLQTSDIQNTKSEVYLPLIVEKKTIGILKIISDKIFYKEFHSVILKNIVVNIVIALDNANAYRQIEKKKDELDEKTRRLFETLKDLQKSNKIIETKNQELVKLSIATNKTDNAIMLINYKGEIEWINEGFTKMYGFTYEEFTRNNKSIFVSNTNKKVLYKLKEAMASKKTISYEAKLRNKNNKTIWVQTTWTPILDEYGSLQQLIAIDSDITKVKKAKKKILLQKYKIENQNFEIKSSMEYARKIQTAILPSENIFKALFDSYFILSIPKDIISGDFYWTHQKNDLNYIAVADCTGHGTPGALMSMLGIAFLDEIVNNTELENPNDILFVLREKIKAAFNQNDGAPITKDGMDISLCMINLKNMELNFSGAFHVVYIIRNNDLIILKGDRMPIGFYELDHTFSLINFKLQKNDIIYMFTDGYVDQFGGEYNRKLKYEAFRSILISINNKSLIEQKEYLFKFHNEWKSNNYQLDDILILSMKI